MTEVADKDKALNTCDGVIEIAANEMLLQGSYVTQRVMNPKLEDEGAVCGGRKACLVGSIFLAYGITYRKLLRLTDHIPSFFLEDRDWFMDERPALKLAYNAFNQAAFEVIEREHQHRIAFQHDYDPRTNKYSISDRPEVPADGWAEFFFERILENHEHDEIREEVISVANRAKELIGSELVVV